MSQIPTAPRRAHKITQYGQTRVDNYYWMRDRDDPETIKYLRAESAYLEGQMLRTKPLQEKLFNELKARIKENDASVPEKRGDYFYYKRYEAGRQYPIFCRKKEVIAAKEDILLDQNELAQGRPFCSIGAFSVSPDGTKLAYSVDFEGNEIYKIQIKDLQTGALYPEVIENTLGSFYDQFGVEWANDNHTFFYAALDKTQRPYMIYRHVVGSNPGEDALIFHEEDETFYLYPMKTRDHAYVLIYHLSTHTCEMRYLNANTPNGEFRTIQRRIKNLEYFATHHKGRFLILNNDGAKNFKLSSAPVENSGKENWRDLIPHREDTLLVHVDAFDQHAVIVERKDGLRQIRICKADDVNHAHYVKFPEPAYSVMLEPNPEFKASRLRFKYSSMVTPNSIVEYDMNTGAWDTRKEDEIPSGYDKSQYVSERLRATAPDGKQIPLSIVYKKGLKKDGTNPTLLYGYGAYGAPVDADFNADRLSLLDRGFVFAIGHIRGGLELGRDWYEDGKLLKKKNSLTDFIACAEHLIAQGFTSREKLAILGGSAGGLLVGACMIMRPDLFKAVICKVPFLDVVTTMSDPSIPLTTAEYDQWGNPDESREVFDYMLSYSPYDNIRAIEYPDMLISTGFNDPRVAFWESAKFVAKLREMKTDNNLLLFHINYDSGHAGASGRYDSLKEVALDYAFLLDRLGIR